MPDPNSNRTLNEALVILNRSLPMYLSHAAPWVAYGYDEARQVLDRNVVDLKGGVRQLTELLNERRHTIDPGEFPMDFTGLHDVGLGYLMKQLTVYQNREIESLESCARRLTGDPEGQALVADIAKSSRGHLEALESIQRQPAAAKI